MKRRMAQRLQATAVCYVVCAALVLLHAPVQAATFCVSTAAELASALLAAEDSALLAAEDNGEDYVIRIVQGTYQGTFSFRYSSRQSLTIEGGYRAGCASRVVDPANTILDAQKAGSVLRLSFSGRSSHVVLDGLTLQNGSGPFIGGLFAGMAGGDVTLTNSIIRANTPIGIGVSSATTVTLSNNTILGNAAGIGVSYAAAVTLMHNTITGNTTQSHGGGIAIGGTLGATLTVILTNNTINDNRAGSGGGISITADTILLADNTITGNTAADAGGLYARATTLTLINNTISHNSASNVFGGGMLVGANTLTLVNNTISSNTTPSLVGIGGGLFISNGLSAFGLSTIILTGNTISHNTAAFGGGMYVSTDSSARAGSVVTLTNNTIHHNTASNGSGGGGFIVGDSRVTSTVTLTNNTIGHNTARSDGGGMWLTLYAENDKADVYNNIVWSNRARRGADLFLDNDGDVDLLPSPVHLFNNDFDQSPAGIFSKLPLTIDASNLNNVDPLFVDPMQGDYHVQADSPVLNKGHNHAPHLPATDKEGRPRIIDGFVDMGAYEFTTDPTLALAVNQLAFRRGETLTLTAIAVPGPTRRAVDAYVAIQLPDGNLLFLQADGSFTREIRPMVRNWPVAPFSAEILRYTFGGAEPSGRYTWLGAVAEPGTIDIIGTIAQTLFTFSP